MNARRTTPLIAATAAYSILHAASAAAASVTPPGDLADWTCSGVCGASPADGDILLSPLGNPLYGFVATSGSSVYGNSPLVLDANSRGSETNGSRYRSGAFAAAAGDVLDVYFNFTSTDGKGFDDYAWGRVIDSASNDLVAWVFTARSSNSNTKGIVPGDVVTKSEFDPDQAIVGYKDWDFTSKDVLDPVNWSHLGFSNGSCWKDNAAGCGFTDWMLSRHTFSASGTFRLEVGVVNWGDEAFDSGLAFDFAQLTQTTPPVPEPVSAAYLLGGLAVTGLALRRRRARRGA